ncbi:hypothetical protein M405DRAFT_932601 [Rhizopogon salebrosus TDB-379]|nr:hypothetical protein M405DRAFT_932601 [Rhizopogon salebrosus TDB-379]
MIECTWDLTVCCFSTLARGYRGLYTTRYILDLGNTYGALFIGIVIAAVLFGVTNVQAFIYFQTHSGTGIGFYKFVVIGLLILDALHLAFMVYALYYSLVSNYANVDVLTEIVWSAKLEVVVGVLIIHSLHLLYVHRIWIVSKGRSRTLPIIVSIVAALSLGVTIAVIWGTYQLHLYADVIQIEWPIFLYLGTIASVDVLYACSLWYLLATSRTGFSSTDSFVVSLIAYTINTGCLTSIVSMADLITAVAMPRNFIFLAIQLIVAKVYINSFLALLNARYYLQHNKNIINSAECRIRHGAYCPEQHTDASDDENFQTSKSIVFKHPNDEETRPTQYAQAVMSQRPIAMAIDMDPFASV